MQKINLLYTQLQTLSKMLLNLCNIIIKQFHYFIPVYFKKGPSEETELELV
jgi:hypothetical protein